MSLLVDRIEQIDRPGADDAIDRIVGHRLAVRESTGGGL